MTTFGNTSDVPITLALKSECTTILDVAGTMSMSNTAATMNSAHQTFHESHVDQIVLDSNTFAAFTDRSDGTNSYFVTIMKPGPSDSDPLLPLFHLVNKRVHPGVYTLIGQDDVDTGFRTRNEWSAMIDVVTGHDCSKPTATAAADAQV
eukprot:TRINITY_DN770_c0_g4_i2.p1 TRINITY_DN770_c0_g4~~TRINITY_DN770_c0_g4_i2.p1  ORF type:complete len:149 (+),score=20.37 TRINITY_DN770_c0_g4_i2:161-607(+)